MRKQNTLVHYFSSPSSSSSQLTPAPPLNVPRGPIPVMVVPVGGKQAACGYLRACLTAIHTENKDHEMFGPLELGELRAPYRDNSRANAVSWWNVVETICNRTYRSDLRIGENMCWMTKTHSHKLNSTSQGTTIMLKSFKIVRFIAFLVQPSDINWLALKTGDETRPFDHFCRRGEATDILQQGYVCINGVEHGEFSTRTANEDRKKCTHGAKALCPGHGSQRVKCVFTHPDGTVQPCRNMASHVPLCVCTNKCY